MFANDKTNANKIREIEISNIKMEMEKYKEIVPYIDLFLNMKDKDLIHIQKVMDMIDNLLEDRYDEVLNTSESGDRVSKKFKGYTDLIDIAGKLSEDDKRLLRCAAIYHDIGKSLIRARHGPEGADVIKDSGRKARKQFCNLGFRRPDLYFISDLIRFHDYLAMIGTGEVSYLIFAEVLSPVSNISLSVPTYANKFLNFLLLLNLADLASSIGKVGGEEFTVLMHDFENIKKAHSKMDDPNVSDGEPSAVQGVLPYKKYLSVVDELQKLAEDHTHERLRRLLRTGLKKFVNQRVDNESDKYLKDEYLNWIDQYNECENNESVGESRPLLTWFSRNYEKNICDMVPINSSLRGLNVRHEFYGKFALICKLDYFLLFVGDFFKTMLEEEIGKEKENRKSPHDLRRDIAVKLIDIINISVELYGDFTSNNTRIGLGFERFTDIYDPNKMLRRLAGLDGEFKEAEACTKFRSMVMLWVLTP